VLALLSLFLPIPFTSPTILILFLVASLGFAYLLSAFLKWPLYRTLSRFINGPVEQPSDSQTDELSADAQFRSLAARWPSDLGAGLFNALWEKCQEVPGGVDERVSTSDLLLLNDSQLRDFWEGIWFETAHGSSFSIRGWYQTLYADIFRGKRVLEVGTGMGLDGMYFIRNGANWHFCDVAPSNLELVSRLVTIFGYNCDGTTLLRDFNSFEDIPGKFDFIYCQGSLINAPFDFARAEALHILRKLKPEGRWIERCYPKERWLQEGSLPFHKWGEITNGKGTPWAEWYDWERICSRFSPLAPEPLLAFSFHQNDFNWFDLRFSHPPSSTVELEQLLVAGSGTGAPVSVARTALKVHNRAQIEADPTKPIVVVTDPQQWSYAISYIVDSSHLAKVQADPRREPGVSVSFRVIAGTIGVGVVDAGLKEYLVAEQQAPFEPGNPIREIVCRLPAHPEGMHFMFRNVAAGGAASRFVLEDISVIPLASNAADPLAAELDSERPVINVTQLLERHWRFLAPELHDGPKVFHPPPMPVFVRRVRVEELGSVFGGTEETAGLLENLPESLLDWKMEVNDAPILAHLYRCIQPTRHLEFGTHEGFGVTLVAANGASDVEVWTINLSGGEMDEKSNPRYARVFQEGETPVADMIPIGEATPAGQAFITDGGSSVGWRYRAAGLASRVHQILGDSRKWDGSSLPDGFFDTVFVDGGHQPEVVISDTRKAMPLLRSGGWMIWHDFCPTATSMSLPATRQVVYAIHQLWPELSDIFEHLFWICPSFILAGKKRSATGTGD
jgi:predicted O-methyltransferase YrrM